MTITKYQQSCFLIEVLGKTLLIDPGSFAEQANLLRPSQVEKLDAILITHEHADHCSPTFIRQFVDRFHPLILTNESVQELLKAEGIEAEILMPGENVQLDDVTITGVEQRHGDITLGPRAGQPAPEDLGFLINNSLYHTGDSHVMENPPKADILCCPIAGPDMDFGTAHDLIEKVEPYLVIPMHYANQEYYPCEPKQFLAYAADLMTEVRLLEDGERIQL
jgi:L-ascorbate metabolism protein UlaG (beta-lactamase superfamily)